MTNAQLSAILAAIPGGALGANVRTNALRAAAVKHRSAVTVVDLLPTPALPVLTDVPTAGFLAFSTNYKVAVAAASANGPTVASAIANVTTSADAANTHAITFPLPQTPHATLYHVFLSTDAAPKYLAQITEAQRAAGCIISAMGTIAVGTPGAGVIEVQAAGTGVATGVAPFLTSSATDPVGLVPLNCAGYSKAHVYFAVATADLRAQPSFSYVAVDAYQAVAGQYGVLQTAQFILGGGSALGLLPMVNTIPVDGSTGLLILIFAIAGQGTSIDVWVELE